MLLMRIRHRQHRVNLGGGKLHVSVHQIYLVDFDLPQFLLVDLFNLSIKVCKVYLIARLKRKSCIHLKQKANLFRTVKFVFLHGT